LHDSFLRSVLFLTWHFHQQYLRTKSIQPVHEVNLCITGQPGGGCETCTVLSTDILRDVTWCGTGPAHQGRTVMKQPTR
jgi:hypothetical protein